MSGIDENAACACRDGWDSILSLELDSRHKPCHLLPLSKVSVRMTIADEWPGFLVEAETPTKGQTGVEMEAPTAISVSCITLYDMLKAIDRDMVVGEIAIVAKEGGKSA